MSEVEPSHPRLSQLLENYHESGAEVGDFLDRFGVRNFYYYWRADNARAVVQVVHGMGDHAGRYLPLILRLRDAGYDVIADDHVGHGVTGLIQHNFAPDRQGELGRGGMMSLIRNVRSVSSIARTLFPGQPLFMIGHSLGSFVAQHIINWHGADYAGFLLTGTGYAMPGWVSTGNFNRRWKGEDDTGLAWLSRDPAVAQGFADDPLCTSRSALSLFGPVESLKVMSRPSRFIPEALPVLILNGAEDPVASPRSVTRLVRAYREQGLVDVDFKIYPEARHEVFQELNREEVFGDVLAWLDRVLAEQERPASSQVRQGEESVK